MKTKSYGMLFLLLLCSSLVWSQDNKEHKRKKVNYKKNPYWIQMMDDPNVNYHEAILAFNEFWKDRGEPEEKDDDNKEEKRSLLKRLFKSEEKEHAENMEYLIPYKRFNQWKRDVEPFVQPDGSILSKEEQLQIWENARK